MVCGWLAAKCGLTTHYKSIQHHDTTTAHAYCDSLIRSVGAADKKRQPRTQQRAHRLTEGSMAAVFIASAGVGCRYQSLRLKEYEKSSTRQRSSDISIQFVALCDVHLISSVGYYCQKTNDRHRSRECLGHHCFSSSAAPVAKALSLLRRMRTNQNPCSRS